MRIEHYLENFPNYIYFWNSSTPFSAIWDNPQREHILLFSNTMTIHRKPFEELLSTYYIAELFELSNYFLGNASEPYMFLRIVDTPVDSVKISFYKKAPHIFNDNGETFGYDSIFRAEQYTEEFLTYLGLLDSWRKTGVMPQGDDATCEFRTVSPDQIRRDFVYTRYYEKHNDEIRALLCDETIRRLSDVADIEETSIMGVPNKIARALFETNFPSYPYIPEKDSVEYPATSIRLQKNDIVEYKGKYFLYYHDTDMEIYAPVCTTVIRAKTISPEYLYFYLTGKTAWRIKTAFSVLGSNAVTPRPLPLKDFPVVLQTEDDQYYKARFTQLAKPERVYEYIEITHTSALATLLKKECADRVHEKYNSVLQSIIKSDFDELKICYEHKAYKAAIILAGSLLEYFLLDWLSELDGVDYFTNDFYDSNGAKTSELYAYIYALRGKLGYSWNTMKTLAHDIRLKRNSVHVKVSLGNPTAIDASSCEQTINNLAAIIRSRNVKLLP